MIRRTLRSTALLLLATFAVGSGCTCAGQRFTWHKPPEEMAAFGGPADVAAPSERVPKVAWVLEWTGESRTPSERGRTTLVCRFHKMTEKARPKLLDQRLFVPLVFAPDELIATDETVVVHSDVELKDFEWALERRGTLGLWFLDVESTADGVVYWSKTLSCEVRRQAE